MTSEPVARGALPPLDDEPRAAGSWVGQASAHTWIVQGHLAWDDLAV